MSTTNDAVAAYCGHMAQIDHIARHLVDYSDDHGWLSPDAIDWTHVATAGEIVALLTAACDRAGIDLTTDPDYFEPPAFAQPDAPMVLFPGGEYHELPAPEDAAPAEPEPCSKCGRRPAESGLARWQACDVCGAPVCDTCAWNDPHGAGHYCSTECAFGADPDQM